MSSINEKMLTGCFFQKVFKNPFLILDEICSPLYKRIFMNKLPINKKKILFVTFNGVYTCNPKAIAKEILKRNLDWELVWATKPERDYKDMPKQIKHVTQYTEEFYREAASAKIWIANGISLSYLGVVKKKEQVYFQTWHGAIGIKRFDTNKDKKWIKKIISDGKFTDYCISNSTFETNLYKNTFWKNVKILEFGHARNDILFKNDSDNIKKKLYQRFNIPENAKIALYAPTFRDDKNLEYYSIDYLKLRDALKKRFGGNRIILTRLHSRMRGKRSIFDSTTPDFVIDTTSYDDIQDLMVLADVGITDYSSWICEFIETKKPGFLFGTDVKDYNNERGFLFPLSDLPYPLAENNNQLTENILNFQIEPFIEKCNNFLSQKGCIDDGHAAERIVDMLTKIINEEK